MAASVGHLDVAGDEREPKYLGESNILSVVGGERMSEVPDPVGKGAVRIAMERQLRKLSQRQFCLFNGEQSATFEPTNNAEKLNINEMWHVHLRHFAQPTY